jgi:anthranilate phosphoribosyltransferase
MKNILNRLINHEMLTAAEAEVLVNISNGSYNPSQISAFLTVFMMRSISIEELSGFRDALLNCVYVLIYRTITQLIYVEQAVTERHFNISTLASFVAAAGVKVAKHGNYGVSLFLVLVM